MSKQSKVQAAPARDRILKVASDLFYNQGYRATGINEVIEKSGVAKATFYNHFPSKDDLGQAYLKAVVAYELKTFDEALAATQGPLKRYLMPLEWLREWLRDTKFRGCAFLHAVAEIPDPENPLRRYGKHFYDGARSRVKNIIEELVASNTEKYGHLDASELTEFYMVIIAGAIALSEIYHEEWPVEHAIKEVQRLIGK